MNTLATPARGRIEAGLGVVTVGLLAITLGPWLPTWAGYLVLWIPMVLAVSAALYRSRGSRHNGAETRSMFLRISWLHVLVGAFAGLLLRAIVMIFELVTVGNLTPSSSFFGHTLSLQWIFIAVVAPTLVAPVVEELFFRGLLLPAIGNNWIGVVGSSALFSLLHFVSGSYFLIAASTFMAGLVFGLLAVHTRSLKASITAHIVYNASLVAMSELGGLNPISL